jgi:hypothetical protein
MSLEVTKTLINGKLAVYFFMQGLGLLEFGSSRSH